VESAWCRSPNPCICRLSCRSTPDQWDSTGRKARVFGAFRHRDEKRGCVQVVGIFKNTGCNTNFRTLRTHSHAEWDGSEEDFMMQNLTIILKHNGKSELRMFKVSFIMPAYNRRFLNETINSFLHRCVAISS
jgi:hypothetical protein